MFANVITKVVTKHTTSGGIESKRSTHIIIVSSRNLNEFEIKLLEKGLKFTPTPQRNTTCLIKDTEEFRQNLRLRNFSGL